MIFTGSEHLCSGCQKSTNIDMTQNRKEKIFDSDNTFVLNYNSEYLRVKTSDQIRFQVEFPKGEQKELRFEMDTSQDLQWLFTIEGHTPMAGHIGRLIEDHLFKKI